MAEFSPGGGVFSADEFNSWLANRMSAGWRSFRVSPGTYSVAAPPPDEAHVALPSYLADVSLDFSGVTLVMQGRLSTAVSLYRWTNVLLAGLSVRYAQPPSNSATITAVRAAGV